MFEVVQAQRWYDPITRLWAVYLIDEVGYQGGRSEYVVKDDTDWAVNQLWADAVETYRFPED